ncbi:hypothetical protein H4J02_03880 [Protaetiibacter sp. SSC-01]|uniref:hypothetical protein n=1 Tax=Protaetiibacter sp. SSC-01 TaxID=2759943 RepID=UPI001656AD85|nr:hypothetical protein [Protaetiibacter sp. SSC-01]QNO38177.1 hypothetical protein H4J02_03880 [Protaetiibacter sp. SSC-01]
MLLNPPYSFRGGSGVAIELAGTRLSVSPAAAFVWRVIEELPNLSGIAAILPEGVLHNIRDRPVWAAIEREFAVSARVSLGARSFRGAVVNAVLVTIDRTDSLVKAGRSAHLGRAPLGVCNCVEIVRGRVPVRVADQGGDTPFIHSTDLAGAVVLGKTGGNRALATPGHLVLFPRVGPRSAGRTRMVDGPVVLSDCVMALRLRDRNSAIRMLEWLRASSDALDSEYHGTGARHITVEAVGTLLRAAGWNAKHVRASTAISACDCAP